MAASTIHVSKIRGLLKDNLSAIVVPTENDDSGAGYAVGLAYIFFIENVKFKEE